MRASPSLNGLPQSKQAHHAFHDLRAARCGSIELREDRQTFISRCDDADAEPLGRRGRWTLFDAPDEDGSSPRIDHDDFRTYEFAVRMENISPPNLGPLTEKNATILSVWNSAKAVKAGAKIMKPAFDVPGVGRIVILLEPGGAGIGWMTPAN